MTDPINSLPLPRLFERLVDSRSLAMLIDAARAEDMHTRGDITSALTIAPDAQSAAQLVARQPGVIAGLPVAALAAKAYDPRLDLAVAIPDGRPVAPGQAIATIRGPLRSMLATERVVLNFLTHLSGIATLTAGYVEQVADTSAAIYDTRKTIPACRALAKYAVRCGGGYCHRLGLHDAVLIKDNHLASGKLDLAGAIAAARRLDPAPTFVEVEVDTLDQLKQVLPLGPDIILLDNMSPDVLRQAVAMRDEQAPGVKLEASGGVNLDTVRAIARTGVDRIAVGAITHSAPALDIGLDIEPE